MIEVSNEIKQAYDKSTKQIDKIIVDNKEYRITKVQYCDDCYDEGNIFGTAFARTLEFEIENNIDLEKKEFEYLTGIYVENDVKWTSLGNFIIQEVNPNDTKNINTVVAMDYMLKSNIEYKTNLKYQNGDVTLLDVAQEACNSIGITLATLDFANSDFIVDSNQFKQETLIRQVFQAIAQLSGSFAKIRSDNKLYFITPKRKGLLVKEVHKMAVKDLNMLPVEKLFDQTNKFDKSSYKELTVKRNTHPINVVSLGMKDVEGENITLRDEESISKNGENILAINDNPFAYTQSKREQLINALFNTVKGFEYTSFEIKCQGKAYLETGDEIVAVDKEGNICSSFLFRFNFKSPNGLESTIEAPSITKATVEYQNVPNALDIAKRTEIIVDKQEQKINSIIKQQTETGEKLTEVEQTIDSITQKVENIEDVTNTVEAIKTIRLENCAKGDLLELHIYGNNTVFDYLYPNDDLYPSNDLYPYGDSRIVVYNALQGSEEITYSKQYELGVLEVLRQNGEVFDEYVLENGHAKIIRRVNKDGTTKAEETIENLGEFKIPLREGDNYIEIKNYTAKLKGKFAVKNTYTDRFATKVEMKSSIEQTAEEINLEVRKKVDENEIVSKINQSAEQITIEAEKLNLNGAISANGNFKIDKDGNLEANNGKFTGGKIELFGGTNKNDAVFTISNPNSDAMSYMTPTIIQSGDGTHYIVFNVETGLNVHGSKGGFNLLTEENEFDIYVDDTYVFGAMHANSYNYDSLESLKKNISKFDIKALDIIKDAELYKFNYKNEKDSDKKHIGFVIGKNYKTPLQVISKSGNGVDAYTMASFCWKGLQELTNEVEQLQQELKK